MQVEPGALLEAPGEVQQLQTLHTLQAGDLMPLTNGVHHAGSELDGLEEGSDAGAGAREERVVVSPLGCWVGWEGRWALPAPAGTGLPAHISGPPFAAHPAPTAPLPRVGQPGACYRSQREVAGAPAYRPPSACSRRPAAARDALVTPPPHPLNPTTSRSDGAGEVPGAQRGGRQHHRQSGVQHHGDSDQQRGSHAGAPHGRNQSHSFTGPLAGSAGIARLADLLMHACARLGSAAAAARPAPGAPVPDS